MNSRILPARPHGRPTSPATPWPARMASSTPWPGRATRGRLVGRGRVLLLTLGVTLAPKLFTCVIPTANIILSTFLFRHANFCTKFRFYFCYLLLFLCVQNNTSKLQYKNLQRNKKATSHLAGNSCPAERPGKTGWQGSGVAR